MGAGAAKTVALTYKAFGPLSVFTVRVLILVPPGGVPANCMVAEISPFSLGTSFQGVEGNFATVQPQEVCTKLMMTSPEEIFVRLKVNSAAMVPLVTLTDFCSASKARKFSIAGCGAAATGLTGGGC